MKIRNIRQGDFKEVIDLSREFYLHHGDEDFPLDYNTAYTGLHAMRSSGGYLRVMEINNRVVGWFSAKRGTHQPHSNVKGCLQIYYHSSLRGVSAVKALIAFHDDFFNYVEKIGYEVAITSSSLPNREVFERVLLQHGWLRAKDRLLRWTRHRRPLGQQDASRVRGCAKAGRAARGPWVGGHRAATPGQSGGL
jgi:hypothetical protein